MIKLGDLVEDTVSGFRGIAISRTEYLNNCVRFCVQPRVDKDGKHIEAQFYDEEQLKVVNPAVTTLHSKVQTGGDRGPIERGVMR